MLCRYRYDFRKYLVIAGVGETMLREKLLLDQTRAGEPAQNIRATGLVIRTTGTRTAKGLLTNESSSSLAV